MSEMEEEKVYEGSIAKAKKNLIYFGIFGIGESQSGHHQFVANSDVGWWTNVVFVVRKN